MARVSQEHLDARRRQILNGAARCFARNGFHATSMQDVLREADLSAGAVYRYFRSKEEIIEAIVAEVLDAMRSAFESAVSQTPPPTPDQLVANVMAQVLSGGHGLPYEGRESLPRLMIQVWTEALRNDRLSAAMREGYASVRGAWTEVVTAYQTAGMMRDDIPADHVARTMIALAQGFAAQQAVFGTAPVAVLQDGVRGLMSMGTQKAG
ncbi:TetR/AcrR family transcriptional regulator [Streptomyces sp. TRM49041]|uniref:TetR/AcrR family transcriptional regulator n=1 Tax=Streptomyces sp. TRM49041 TaxID=2603216 RepID=UPI0011EF6385|nr:TetR/AcrR family transcriptional regulator [Streptomyces sp. TRM49041]